MSTLGAPIDEYGSSHGSKISWTRPTLANTSSQRLYLQ